MSTIDMNHYYNYDTASLDDMMDPYYTDYYQSFDDNVKEEMNHDNYEQSMDDYYHEHDMGDFYHEYDASCMEDVAR